MAKARRIIAEMLPSQDVVIEVLDARMPASSENPVVAEFRKQRPCIKVLSKDDLADPDVTRAWMRHFEASSGRGEGAVAALAVSTKRPGEARARVRELCRTMTRRQTGPGRETRAMIVGIPNVGKSTLINTLMGRKVAVVGDEPGVTKGPQRITLPDGMTLSDHPGILWPKVDDEETSLRLAFGGAIPDAAFDYETVGLFGARALLERYPKLLLARYRLDPLPATPAALLEEIGRRRGALRSGGVIDLHKAADVLVHDFRSGALGRISLETPSDRRAPRERPAEPEGLDDMSQ
jgi:ribosome biogenesis GTPase A